MSAGSGPIRSHAFAAQAFEHRDDDVDFLAAEMAAFAGMRIEAEHGDARIGDAEIRAQRGVHDAQRARQAVAA